MRYMTKSTLHVLILSQDKCRRVKISHTVSITDHHSEVRAWRPTHISTFVFFHWIVPSLPISRGTSKTRSIYRVACASFNRVFNPPACVLSDGKKP